MLRQNFWVVLETFVWQIVQSFCLCEALSNYVISHSKYTEIAMIIMHQIKNILFQVKLIYCSSLSNCNIFISETCKKVSLSPKTLWLILLVHERHHTKIKTGKYFQSFQLNCTKARNLYFIILLFSLDLTNEGI